MIGFLLGREFKLSISEIISLFGDKNIDYVGTDILVLRLDYDEVKDKLDSMGGSIKVMELEEIKTDIPSKVVESFPFADKKVSYGLSLYGEKKGNLKNILGDTKKALKKENISSRYVNKDNKNLSSAQIIGEKLIPTLTDYNVIYTKEKTYFGVSRWVQDIEGYSKRDYSKSRDMKVGMMPPKLSQILINLSGATSSIYDPFCGLGSILIEGVIGGKSEIYGSDLEEKNVHKTKVNLGDYKSKYEFKLELEELDASRVGEGKLLTKTEAVVSEGYLGEIMNARNISMERIMGERKKLEKLYNSFFSSLSKTKYKGTIVICFPFWEIEGKYIYFEEVYKILSKYAHISPLLPDNIEYKTTKMGSLLYKRSGQFVGREVFRIKLR